MRLRLWISLCLITSIAGLALFATSCGSSNKTQIRLLHAVVTYTNVNMLIDGNTVASSIGYASASSYSSVSSGSRHVQVEPTGSSTPIIDVNQSLGSGTTTTALAYLDTSNNIKSSFLTDNNSAPSSGNFNIRIINAAPAIGSGGTDVYVVPSGTSIAGVSASFFALPDNGTASTYLSLQLGAMTSSSPTPVRRSR